MAIKKPTRATQRFAGPAAGSSGPEIVSWLLGMVDGAHRHLNDVREVMAHHNLRVVDEFWVAIYALDRAHNLLEKEGKE